MPSGTHIDRPSSPGMPREETKGKAETFVKTGKSAYVMMKASAPVLLVLEEAGRHWIVGQQLWFCIVHLQAQSCQVSLQLLTRIES